MPGIILHVGLHKTATSALQERLRKNSGKLFENGFFYPESDPLDAHHWLVSLLRVHDDGALIDPAGEEIFLARLAEQLVQADGRDIVISSEIFSENVSRSVVRKLPELFEKVTVVLYLRRQDTLLESVHNQMLKQAGFRSDDILRSGFYPACALYDTIELWRDLVGEKNVIVRRYDSSKLFMDDITLDFLNAIGAPLDGQWLTTKSGQVNDSLSMIEYLVLDRLSEAQTPEWSKAVDIACKIVRERYGKHNCRMVGNYLTCEERRAFLQTHAEGNAKILDEYFPGDDTLFSPPSNHADRRHDAALLRDVDSAHADVLRELAATSLTDAIDHGTS
jgi:hypothetical protein